VIIDCDKTRMSSKKTAKIEMKLEGTMATSKERKRGKANDSDGSDAGDDDAHIQSARTVKKEKSEVKSEVSVMPAKKRKRGNNDGDEDAKDANSDHVKYASVRKKKNRTKRHACTEPGCGKDSVAFSTSSPFPRSHG
jgi:hypothetical protein